MAFFEEQQKKVAFGEAVEDYVKSPVHKQLSEIMASEVEKLQKQLRKGTGSLVGDDQIRARLAIWDKWDSTIKGWLNAKKNALSRLAEERKEG